MDFKKNKPKVLVAMSGGVDSSVAAKLLVDQGYEVMGIFLHFWKDTDFNNKEIENKCCSVQALMDARRVCRQIGIRLYTLNFSEIFKEQIVDDFLQEYQIGHTPNPCVRCNKFVKLGLLIERARQLGFDKIASGHYARIVQKKEKYQLYRGVDKKKDQSYFLSGLTQDQLKYLILPLGDLTKTEVRNLAEKFQLPTAQKNDSQEICFVSSKNHNDFLKKYLNLKSGEVRLTRNEEDKKNNNLNLKIGTHQGLPLYTLGQRKGIEIGGIGPFYAVKMDYKKNILFVSGDNDDPLLYSDQFLTDQINWIIDKPKSSLKCEVMIRSGAKLTECEIFKKGKIYQVRLKSPLRVVMPGQSAVFYKGDEVIGMGIIK